VLPVEYQSKYMGKNSKHYRK